MISAGIYGTIDLAKDIKYGTLIQYEREDAPEIKPEPIMKRNKEQTVSMLNVEAKEEKKSEPSVHKTPELKMEYFSRSAPIIYDEKLFGAAKTDSTNKDSTVIAATDIRVVLKSEEKSAEIKEERKFSPKLFSRGRPRNLKKEIAVTETDSLKKE
jgi:hypothetical protein